MAKAIFFAPAVTHGSLYRIDWYPGLIDDSSSSIVYGEIYYCDHSLLQELDDFEGDYEYERKKLIVCTSDRNELEAFVWVYKKSVDSLEKIPSGDWLLYMQQK